VSSISKIGLRTITFSLYEKIYLFSIVAYRLIKFDKIMIQNITQLILLRPCLEIDWLIIPKSVKNLAQGC
jgi:hypothetical protein